MSFLLQRQNGRSGSDICNILCKEQPLYFHPEYFMSFENLESGPGNDFI